jgi:hypothetical protein
MTGLSDLEQRLTNVLAERAAADSPPADAWERLVAEMSALPTAASAVTAEAPSLLESVVDRSVEPVEAGPEEPRGDDLRVDYRQLRPDKSDAPSAPKRWFGVAIAAAATILAVVGVVVLAEKDSGDVVTASSGETGPALLPGVTDPNVSEWSRLPHDGAVFGAEEDLRISSVTVGGPGLVAVGSVGSDSPFDGGDGDAAVWTSVDGLTWSRVPHDEAIFGGEGQQAMNNVTAGGPGLVAVGHSGVADSPRGGGDGVAVVWTSVGGITWSRVPDNDTIFGGDVDQGMFGVTVGGPGLVAVGGAGHGWNNGGDAAVWTSVDGIKWSRVSHDEAVFGGSGTQWMNSVTVGGPGLVAVGSNGVEFSSDAAVWTSSDGITWSRVPDDDTIFGETRFQEMTSVTAGGPGLVAVGIGGGANDLPAGPGNHAVVWTSVDGITWFRVSHDETIFGGTGGQAMADVTVAGTTLVAVGGDGGGYGTRADAAVWTSIDGITWSRIPHDETMLGGAAMRSVTAASSGLVAVGGDSLGDDEATDLALVWVAAPN